ncbi:MAG: RHS repeat protein [bacterium]|nr:RHS repeat protein [bacterium]
MLTRLAFLTTCVLTFAGCAEHIHQADDPSFTPAMPLVGQEEYVFDKNRALVRKVDSRGAATDFRHAQDSRTVEASGNDKARIEYDDLGRPVRWFDHGRIEAQYDAWGRLARLTFARSPIKHILYTWGPTGRLESIQIVDGATNAIEYHLALRYDSAGRMVAATDVRSGETTTFQHDAIRAEVVRHLPDGVKTTFRYGREGQVQQVQHVLADGTKLRTYDWHMSPDRSAVSITEVGMNKPQRATQWNVVDIGAERVGRHDLRDSSSTRFQFGADKRVSMRRDRNGTTHFMHVPGPGGGKLVAEYSPQGPVSKVYVIGGGLNIEYNSDRGSVHLLEGQDPRPAQRAADHSAAIGNSSAFRQMAEAAASGLKKIGGTKSVLSDTLDLHKTQDSYGNSYFDLQELARRTQQKFSLPPRELPLKKIGKWADRVGLGVAVLSDVANLASGEKSWGNILVGDTTKWGVKKLGSKAVDAWVFKSGANKLYAGALVGHSLDLVFEYGLRGTRFEWTDPNDVQAFFETVALGAGGLIPVARPFMGAALSAEQFLQDAVFAPTARSYGRYRGSRGVKAASDWIYLGARALVSGSTEAFENGVGSQSLKDTLFLPASPWAGRAYRQFETAIRAGNTHEAAELLSNNRSLRKLLVAGGNAGQIDSLISSLRKQSQRTEAETGRNSIGVAPTAVLDSAERRLGGVEVATPATFTGHLGKVVGVVWDAATERLLIVSDDGIAAGIALDSRGLAEALCLVFDAPRNVEKCGLQFSLDPWIKTQPDGAWQRAVYFDADPRGFGRSGSLGLTAYFADLRLKIDAFDGRRIDLGQTRALPKERIWTEEWDSGRRVRFVVRAPSEVTEVPHLPEIYRAAKDRAKNSQRNRLWLVSELVEVREAVPQRVRDKMRAFRFDRVLMRVESRRQKIGIDGSLVDASKVPDPVTKSFCDAMRRVINSADAPPEYESLRECLKCVGAALWIRELGVPVDLAWARRVTAERVDRVLRVSRLRVDHRTEKRQRVKGGVRVLTETISLSGGVDGRVKLKPIPDDGSAASMQKAVVEAIRKAPNRCRYQVSVGRNNKKLVATVLPLTERGIKSWQPPTAVQHEGFLYSFDAKRRPVSATDAEGRVTRFEWHGRRLAAIERATDDSFVRVARTEAGGATVRIRPTQGAELELHYDSRGALTRTVHDGRVTQLREDPIAGTLTVDHADGTREELSFDAVGVLETVRQSSSAGRDESRVRWSANEEANTPPLSSDFVEVENDDRGRPLRLVAGSATARWEHGAKGSETRVQLTFDPHSGERDRLTLLGLFAIWQRAR